ncbi:MAG TPA: NAD+ synthase [Gammaproteobacteria bacterium]|nr:NAD+ synthase [Gammaproteobacteria bacterium]
MSGRLRIVIAQLDFMVGDIAGNAERIAAAAEEARDRLGADCIVFPELALTGYPPEDLLLRPAFATQVLDALQGLCRRIAGIDALVGLPFREGRLMYNSACLLRDGRVAARYDKHLLPNYSVFDEKRYFCAGHAPLVVDLKGVAVGVTICEDVWHPEPVAAAAAAGARLVININASPYHVHKGREREEVVAQRVAECGLPVVYANLVGGQDELVFDGESFVMDADGRLALRAPSLEEGLIPVDFEIPSAGPPRPLPGTVTPPACQEAEVYGAIVLGVRDYIEKNRFPGVVMGLSGGIDSALTLAIAVDAIGAERVEAVMMPSRFTADMSVEDARAQCRALGVEHHQISIEPPFQSFLSCLEPEFGGAPFDTTEENIQARCRGIILMAISNKKGYMVLTTGNKSELAVGYATLYGDMAGGFAPIKDVPKTLVYRLARYRNRRQAVIPERVLERPPSAELAPGQKDVDALPPYEILDPILELYIEQDRSPAEIVAAGFERETVRRVVDMVNRNEYKRRQAPPGVRITRRAFGRDRRYPITSGFREPV